MFRTLTRAVDRLRTAWGETLADQRGDVPGWVLVTLMTAGLLLIPEPGQ